MDPACFHKMLFVRRGKLISRFLRHQTPLTTRNSKVFHLFSLNYAHFLQENLRRRDSKLDRVKTSDATARYCVPPVNVTINVVKSCWKPVERRNSDIIVLSYLWLWRHKNSYCYARNVTLQQKSRDDQLILHESVETTKALGITKILYSKRKAQCNLPKDN